MIDDRKLILVGAGGHGISTLDVALSIDGVEVAGFLDDGPVSRGREIGFPILGAFSDIPQFCSREFDFVVAMGQVKTSETRRSLYKKILDCGGTVRTLFSPHSYVSPRAVVGAGTVVFHGALINAGARVGANCIVNSQALIEHDAAIGDHSHISTGALINGGAKIGNDSFVGSGAVVFHGAVLEAGSVLGAGKVYSNKR